MTASNEAIGSVVVSVSPSGHEGTGGAGLEGTAGRDVAVGAPVATGGGISDSFTGFPFSTAAIIDSRVCQEKTSIITE